MKKWIIMGLFLCFVCGCSDENYIECNNSSSLEDNLSVRSQYILYYKGSYITKVKSKEFIESTDASLLEKYKIQIEEDYKEFNQLDYYSNTVSIEDDTLISSTIINYEKIDMKKLIEIDSSNQEMITNGKIKLEDLKRLYLQGGATCK